MQAAAVVLCAAVIVPCALAGATAAPDPKAMVVHAGDLPRGFVQQPHAGYVTTARAQATEARRGEDFAELGRATGYEESFVGSTQGGQVMVASTATVFKTRDGARRALAFIVRDGADPNRFVTMTSTRLGDESHLYQVLGVAFTYLIAWRTGNVLSTVEVGGAQAADAVRLGHTQQRRVATAIR